MRSTRCIVFVIVLVGFFLMGYTYALAQEEILPETQRGTQDLHGKLLSTEGEHISNGIVTINIGTTVRKAISDQEGQFYFKSLISGHADIIYEAHGYKRLEEKGVLLTGEMDLSKTLQSKWWERWSALILLIPGVLGLLIASVKEEWRKHKNEAMEEDPEDGLAGIAKKLKRDNRFWVALLNGAIWAGSLLLLAWLSEPYSKGIYFFDPEFKFDFYVPILGFIGALLYVLDLCRRGREDIPRGTEFGMRIVMGPYVAIVMVLLFGNNLQFVDLESPIAKGTVAFFSGLLVVIALQGLIERGNEWLGRWRRKSRYEPSDVAKKFGLTEEEDLRLRKAGILHLPQLREGDERELKIEAEKAGFDENLIVDFKKRLMKQQDLRELVGDSVTARLEDIGIETIREFSQLTDRPLKEVAEPRPSLDVERIKVLRDEARKLVQP